MTNTFGRPQSGKPLAQVKRKMRMPRLRTPRMKAATPQGGQWTNADIKK